MNKLIILMTILFVGSSPYSFAANSFTCISKDKTIAPRPITNEWKEAHGDWNRRQDWVCCENLVLNPKTRVCEDKSMIDLRFKFCKSHSECVIGLGCFPQSTPELYTTDSLDPNEIVIWKKHRTVFEQQQATLNGPERQIGEFCYRNMECRSYRCDSFKCVNALICRHAHKGDVAPPSAIFFDHGETK